MHQTRFCDGVGEIIDLRGQVGLELADEGGHVERLRRRVRNVLANYDILRGFT